MSLEAGFTIPSAMFYTKDDDGINANDTVEYFAGRKIVVFALPGAFTPTCSARHLPTYIEHHDALKAAGVDAIACLAVNDAHVMHAWAMAEGASDKIDMLADSTTAVSAALGILFDMGGILGKRATRCAFIVEDGVVGHVFMEKVGAFEVSDAGTVLAALTA